MRSKRRPLRASLRFDLAIFAGTLVSALIATLTALTLLSPLLLLLVRLPTLRFLIPIAFVGITGLLVGIVRHDLLRLRSPV
jgi:hypothetical protein